MAMSVGGIANNKEDALQYYPIQRGRDVLMFIAQPVWSMDEFREKCPHPVPGENSVVFQANGKRIPNYKCPQYLQDVEEHDKQRWGFMVLKSLEPSNLEIDGINLDDPSTWANVSDVLIEELGHFEFKQIMGLVDKANSMDAETLEENLQSFFTQREKDLVTKTKPNG